VPGRLSIGFIAPAEGYPDSPLPDLRNQPSIVRKLDEVDALHRLTTIYKSFRLKIGVR
jgi:hypothetical protein